MSPSRQPPEFFVDRSLGRHRVPALLRRSNWNLCTHHEVFGDRDEEVADAEWLEYCGREGLAVLSKDRRLRYRPEEIAAIRRYRVKAFVLTRGNLRATEQAGRFSRNRESIVAACGNAGPFVFAVQADRVMRIFPSLP